MLKCGRCSKETEYTEHIHYNIEGEAHLETFCPFNGKSYDDPNACHGDDVCDECLSTILYPGLDKEVAITNE